MTTNLRDLNLDQLRTLCAGRLNTIFTQYLSPTPSLDLKTAMTYSLENGGKHLRPLLIYATGIAFGATLDNLDIPASAVEIIHTYSLIHDDLPCMDNADLRRGKPTNHIVHGQGMAVLAGDALHTLAMQIIVSHPTTLSADRRLAMIKTLSHACGPYGMAAGQAFDITVMNDPSITSDMLIDIYGLKTGALLTACLALGWLASDDEDDHHLNSLIHFGSHIGLAFQIQDDILDIESTSDQLGKTQGIDAHNLKITYPKLVGLLEAKAKVQSLYQTALESINYLGDRAQLLREITRSMLERQK